jgi:hypothetical protein
LKSINVFAIAVARPQTTLGLAAYSMPEAAADQVQNGEQVKHHSLSVRLVTAAD